MQRRLLVALAGGGLLLAGLMLLPGTAARAQCGPNEPNCEKEKKATPTDIPATPTSTPVACTERLWYVDADADGYGSIYGSSKYACEAPVGYGGLPGDCNDTNASIRPGATDICGDGVDQDCNGSDAVCAVAAPAPITDAGLRSEPISPLALGGGGLLLGILIGLLIPFKLGSFFDSQPGAKAGTVNRGPLQVREAALNAREAALNVREAALNAREAALRGGAGPGTL